MKSHKINSGSIEWLTLGPYIVLEVVRFAFLKFHYFPLLDDWWYYGEAHFQGPWTFFFQNRLYAPRPFMGIVNVLLISPFWPHLGIVFFTMVVLNGLNGALAYRLLHRLGLPISYWFLVFFGFFPLWNEAIIWIAAAVPIVLGIFLMILSLHLLLTLLDGPSRPWPYLLLYGFLFLLSLGFYEPVAAMSLVATLLIILTHRTRPTARAMALISGAAFMLIATFYVVFFSTPGLASRVSTHWGSNLSLLIKNLRYVYMGPPLGAMIAHGTKVGIPLTATSRYALALTLIAVLTTLFFVYFGQRRHTKLNQSQAARLLAIGVIFSITPLVPFIVQPWVAFRDTYPPAFGLAIALATLIQWLSQRHTLRVLFAIFASGFIMMGVVTSFHDSVIYQKSSQIDQLMGRETLSLLTHSHHTEGIIVNTHWANFPIPGFYGQRVQSAFSVSWAATALINTQAHAPNRYTIRTLSANTPHVISGLSSPTEWMQIAWKGPGYRNPSVVQVHLAKNHALTMGHRLIGHLHIHGHIVQWTPE